MRAMKSYIAKTSHIHESKLKPTLVGFQQFYGSERSRFDEANFHQKLFYQYF